MPVRKQTARSALYCTLWACLWCTPAMLGLAAMDASLAENAAETATAKQGGARTIHILPLGDSITQGGRNDRPEYTYRYPLYFMLKEAGYDVDFIGSMKQGINADAVWPDKNGIPFDPDHEGHYGWKTVEVRDQLPEWIARYPVPPDIVLIDLGSNDEGAADYQTAIVQPLKDIVALLRKKNPDVTVLLGHFLSNGRKARSIRPLLEQVARETSTPASPVTTVLHYKGWYENPALPYTDTFDWAHPNPSGQQKMAANYFKAMRPYIDRLNEQRTSRR